LKECYKSAASQFPCKES